MIHFQHVIWFELINEAQTSRREALDPRLLWLPAVTGLSEHLVIYLSVEKLKTICYICAWPHISGKWGWGWGEAGMGLKPPKDGKLGLGR